MFFNLVYGVEISTRDEILHTIIWKAVTALSEHFSLFAVVYLTSLCGGFI